MKTVTRTMSDQAKILRVFASLGESAPDRLPAPSWSIYSTCIGIYGLVDDRDALVAWAGWLQEQITEDTHEKVTRGRVRTTWDGVPVEIWAELRKA